MPRLKRYKLEPDFSLRLKREREAPYMLCSHVPFNRYVRDDLFLYHEGRDHVSQYLLCPNMCCPRYQYSCAYRGHDTSFRQGEKPGQFAVKLYTLYTIFTALSIPNRANAKTLRFERKRP